VRGQEVSIKLFRKSERNEREAKEKDLAGKEKDADKQ
jgi:hypothetical protein